MNDASVRKFLRSQLRHYYSGRNDVIVIEEFGVLNGLGRIDMLVIDGLLHGIEIKSEKDTLRRLEDQIRLFSAAFDKMTLFVAFKHADKALRTVPEWWGVYLLATGKNGVIDVYPAREPKNNPMPDCLAIAKLLWKSEALDLLESLKAATGVRSVNRSKIHLRLAKVATLEQIRCHVRQSLSRRKSMQSVSAQKLNDD